MAKLQIDLDYDIDLSNYKGANSVREAIQQDIESLQNGLVTLAEFVEYAHGAEYRVID